MHIKYEGHSKRKKKKVYHSNFVVFITKTYHLKDGQVFFPPQILLHFWTHCGEHIVSVHDYVHEGIQETEE